VNWHVPGPPEGINIIGIPPITVSKSQIIQMTDNLL